MATTTKANAKRIEQLENRIVELEGMLGKPSAESYGAPTAQMCSLPVLPEREFAPEASPERVRAILTTADKWVNGTNIHYYLFDSGINGGSAAEQQVVRDAFQVWADVGIGLTFTEVQDIRDAELRIGFRRNDGSWSYVGTVNLRIGQNERTMNFGWDITQPGPNGLDTAIHEIGHALGENHEHQNPHAGIVWNRDAVYDYFARTQNPPWDRATTDHNILNTLNPANVEGSNWDPDSVMHYSFARGLIDQPVQFRNGLEPAPGLSEKDKEVIRTAYPPLTPAGDLPELKAFQSELLSIEPGEQKDFAVLPGHTREYTFATFGSSDTVMVLFEDVDGDPVFVEGDDDSGFNRNARFKVRLMAGRRYKLSIRLYYNWAEGETAVMMW